jgi:RsiW-degrading membrane proteinase PrsW (M82 family)
MNYIENVFICIAAPFIIALICAKERSRKILIFILCGIVSCLLSSYISTFAASVEGVGLSTASVEIAPLVEEIMKLLPILFFLLVFEPEKEDVAVAVFMTAVGFATFENVCFLAQNGAEGLFRIVIRGFGAGAMHVVCGAIVGTGLIYIWKTSWLRAAGTIGLLALAITYHGIYNILISQTGAAAVAGFLLPVLTAVLVAFIYSPVLNLLEKE